jgi:hypothetical protein
MYPQSFVGSNPIQIDALLDAPPGAYAIIELLSPSAEFVLPFAAQRIHPYTSSVLPGLVVPMPTLPFPRIVIIAVPLELLTNEYVFAPAEKVFVVDAIRIPTVPEL